MLRLHVQDGRVRRVETDPGEDPEYRACLRGRACRQLVYDPERLLYPLRRKGERGAGTFERISWDTALDEVAAQLKRVRALYGSRAIVLLCSAGDPGWIHTTGLIDRVLSNYGGYTGVYGTLSDEGPRFASMATYGVDDLRTANSPDNLLKCTLIILWGWNPVVTRAYGHLLYYLRKVKESGIPVVSIDPRFTETAALLDARWIPIRPGTDAALMAAMANVIISNGLHDRDFLAKYTLGFDEYKNYVTGLEDGVPKTPRWAEEISGVPEPVIEDLARRYATARPAALCDGFAPGRTAFGEQFNRSAATLIAMTGNLGHGMSAGCGPLQGMSPFVSWGRTLHSRLGGQKNPIDLTSPYRKDAIAFQRAKRKGFVDAPKPGDHYWGGPSSAYLNRVRLADAILNGRDGGYPADYRMLYMVTVNYLNQYANTNKIARALRKLDFIVAHEQFMTPTARFADILLPQNTILERNDLIRPSLAPFYGNREKAIEAPGESKSPYQIAAMLADRLGLSGLFEKTAEEWREAILSECKDIPDREKLRADGIHRIASRSFVAFERQLSDPAGNPFRTPSGKIEIYSQDLADFNDHTVPAIPKYILDWEGPGHDLAGKYPLQLITTHYWRRTHSRYDRVPWLRELQEQAVLMNGADARARGIADGDLVRVFNDRGETVLPARVSERILPGVVDIPEGAWFRPDERDVDRGGCPNVLISDEPSPGGALCSNTALVQVERMKEGES